jgi:8-oxo-dGTP diphosphatase
MAEKHVRVGVGVFIFKDGKFLMLQRKGSHGEGSWSVPGGHLEFGESFEDTARREVTEETSLEIKNVRFGALTNDHFIDEDKHYVTIWMMSDLKGGIARITEPEKCTAQKWCTFDDLPQPLFLTWQQLFSSEFFEKVKAELS